MELQTAIRVAVVDDHDMLRKGLSVFLMRYPDIEIVGDASNGEEAVALCATKQPHIILMDLMMPVMDGITATRHIRQNFPDIRVIALTGFSEERLILDMIEAGAMSVLLKRISSDELVNAIRAARQGTATYAPEVASILVRSVQQHPRVLLKDLSLRERQVLGLMVKGMRNSDIAGALSISIATTKTHVAVLLAKLGVKSRTEAIVLILSHNLNADDFTTRQG